MTSIISTDHQSGLASLAALPSACWSAWDAFIAETGEDGRMPSYGKVGALAVVGNEDGAHHVGAEIYQALNDLGFSLAPNAMAYWVGAARSAEEYRDLTRVPESTMDATQLMVRNAVHLARMLRQSPYPAKP